MRDIVITGPTGAVGMALIQRCIEEKRHVLAICHKGSERNSRIPDSPYVKRLEADVRELAGTEAGLAQGAVYGTFYHLGWMGTTGRARDDVFLQNENVRGTLEAVKLAKRLGCTRFIGAGSQAEYGRVKDRVSLKPDTPAAPETGYGMAKLCAGQMSRLLCGQLGLEHVWVRILSVYGPFDNENAMIPGALRKLAAGQEVSFTPGGQLWDYLYSGDAARALLALGERGISGSTYVLGSGRVRPLKEYIEEMYRAVCEKVQSPGRLGLGDIPYGERQIMYLAADISRLRADTGFEPEVDFEEGIRETLRWILEGET